MIHYFVDYENVHDDGLVGVDKVIEPIVVHIFNSQQGMKSFSEALYAASSLLVSWKFEMAVNGQRNALDIQLAAYLGIAVGLSPSDTFVIVSKDKGYDSLIASLAKKGYSVSRQVNIGGDSDSPVLQEQEDLTTLSELGSKLRSLIPETVCDDDSIIKIEAIIKDAVKISDVSKGVIRLSGVKKGQQMYRYIQSFIKSHFKKELLTKDQLRSVLTLNECSDKQLSAIVKEINSSSGLLQISNYLNKTLGNSKKGSSVYQKIKPIIIGYFKN